MRLLVPMLALSVLGGCKPDRPSDSARAREARARATSHSLAEAQRRGVDPVAEEKSGGLTDAQRAIVVATIGESQITLGDVERQLASQPAFARARYRSFDKKVEFLNNIVQFEMLAAAAQKQGYATDPDVVLAMKRAMIQKFTASDLQEMVKVSAITPEEIGRFYDNNKSMFVKPEQVRASHILFETQESADRALAELKGAVETDPPRARVVFADFVRRLSKDKATIHRNGDLGFFSKDGYLETEQKGEIRVPVPLVDAVFALRAINSISSVLKSDAGWHVVQLTNRRPGVNRTVDDAKRQITNILLREKKDAARKAYIAKLRAEADVKIFEEPLKQLDVAAVKDSGSQAKPTTEEPVNKEEAAKTTKPALVPNAKRPPGVINPGRLGAPQRLPAGALQKKPAPPGQPTDRLDGRKSKEP